jgi:hypothetical protein
MTPRITLSMVHNICHTELLPGVCVPMDLDGKAANTRTLQEENNISMNNILR